ncbi:hypothetical protein GCM10010449_21430 [Streptomyces rectiviolaceus]|uniref:Uncharacterized protein n=1 Tax=Streptomyces rectiviolaceus TaxID=332591 RepID=A0ABP6MDA8_9ACTN
MGEEGEAEVAVAGLGDEKHTGRGPLRPDEGAERGACLARGDEGDEDEGALGEMPVPCRRSRLGAACGYRFQASEVVDQ